MSNRVKTGNVAPMMCSLATRIVRTVEEPNSPHIEEDEEIKVIVDAFQGQ